MPRILRTQRQRTAGGNDADIVLIEKDDGSLTLSATVNGETYQHGVTIGAVDQPLPVQYGQAEFAADLQRAQDFAVEMAESAARKEALKAAL